MPRQPHRALGTCWPSTSRPSSGMNSGVVFSSTLALTRFTRRAAVMNRKKPVSPVQLRSRCSSGTEVRRSRPPRHSTQGRISARAITKVSQVNCTGPMPLPSALPKALWAVFARKASTSSAAPSSSERIEPVVSCRGVDGITFATALNPARWAHAYLQSRPCHPWIL